MTCPRPTPLALALPLLAALAACSPRSAPEVAIAPAAIAPAAISASDSVAVTAGLLTIPVGGKPSNSLVIFPALDAGLPTPSQVLLSVGSGCTPHGAAYYDLDHALVACQGGSKVLVVQVSTASVVATIDTSGKYNGMGTIAVSPDLQFALGATDTTLAVIRAPFAAGATVSTLALPSSAGTGHTQVVVFDASGTAWVRTASHIVSIPPPYTSIAFSIFLTGGGSIAVSPDGKKLIAPDFAGSVLRIFTAPFSAASTPASVTVAGADFGGVAISPDGKFAITASVTASTAWVVRAPFGALSAVETLAMPASSGGFEDVSISGDARMAVLGGGAFAASPLVAIRAPFTAAGATTYAIPVTGGTRGAGAYRFVPMTFAPKPTVSLSAPPGATTGADLTATLTYGNAGNVDLTGTVLRVPIPTGTSFVSASDGGWRSGVGENILWMPGTIPAGATGLTVSFTLRVTASPGEVLSLANAVIVGDGTAETVAPTVSVPVRAPPAVCGNGAVEAPEQCDDGNTDPADGCSASCALEPGYTCPTAGAACRAVIGDGLPTGGEQCDDGNAVGGDGCDGAGQLEPGSACSSAGPDLVQNGSFDEGAAGWTSGYAWASPATPGALSAEGTWSVGSDGHLLDAAIPAGFRDAEGSAANAAAYFNGGPAPLGVLSQVVTLTAGRTYVLSMSATNWRGADGAPSPRLSISIGGQRVTTSPTLASSGWVRVAGTFVAASSGPATLQVVNDVTAATGNDFAVDAVSLREAAPQACATICVRDDECGAASAGAGAWCDTTAIGHPGLCAAPLPPGAPIPTIPHRDPADPALDGTCTPENARTVCDGGACNATTGTCASTSGACVEASQCASNVCLVGACTPQYRVTFRTDGTAEASLSGATTQILLAGEATSAVTAIAPPAHNFAGWTGTGGFTSVDNPLVVTGVAGDLELTARFAGAGSIAAVSGDGQSATVGTAYAAPLCLAVRDTDGVLLAGAPVQLAVPGDGASATLTAALSTGADGVACTDVTANTVAGPVSISATSGPASAPGVATLTNAPGAPAAWEYAHGAAAEQSATVGAAFAKPLSLLVRDGHGNPVPGVLVTFGHHGGSGLEAILSSGSATTDASGVAEVTASAGRVAGWESLEVAFGGLPPVTAFTLRATPDVPGALAADPRSTPQTGRVGGEPFAVPLGVTVTDRWGNPVPGVAASFTASGAVPCARLAAASALTDGTGRAEVLASSGTLAGTCVVTVEVAGLQATFSLTNTVGEPGAILVAGGGEQRASVDGAFAAPLVVEVQDAWGNPVPGVLVGFQVSGAAATATLSASSLVTGGDGRASVTASPGTVAGTFQVTASAQGVAAPATFSLTLDPGAPAAAATNPVSDGQAAQVASGFQNPLSVVVRDAHGNPVPGVLVTFSAPGTGARADLSATSATTGADGVASVLATAGTVAGAYQVTARVEGAESQVTFALSNQPGVPNVLSSIDATLREATVDASLGTLSVSIRDRFGNPVPGVEVTFTAPATGATAVLGAGRATTDADGLAAVTARAGTTSGAYEVVASAEGVAAAVRFALVNAPGAPAALLAGPTSQDQSTRVGEPFGAPLTVAVLDAHGNPVPGMPVGFACPAAGATCALDAGSALTDARGEATVHATAGTRPGALDVIATVEGFDPVALHLQVLVGLPGSIASTGGASQQAPVLSAYADRLGVVVEDAFGNPVPGVEVAFEVVTTGPQSVVLGAASATTDAAGLASVPAAANGVKGVVTVRARAPGVASPVEFTLTNTPLDAALALDVQLPVFGTVITEAGTSHLRARVGPDAGGAPPTGTVTFRATRTIELVPGQAGVTQDGDAIVARLVGGVVDVEVRVVGWRSRTLEASYAPDEAGALTWNPVTTSVDLVADVPHQKHGGGCSTGGDPVVSAVPLLLLALRLRRRRAHAPSTGRTSSVRRGLLVAALVGGLLPGAAQAQWTVGLRTSVAVAGGDAVKGSPMSDGVKRQFPVELEVSRRLLPWLDVGALGAWGVGQVGATCQGSCSASVLRLGIQAAWRLDPVGEVLPWVGLGVGYEWARYRVSEGGDTLRVTLRGVELLQLQGGADWSVGTRLTIGPFASVALGRYDHLTVGSPFGESSGGVPSRATHAWFGLGVRGSWRL